MKNVSIKHCEEMYDYQIAMYLSGISPLSLVLLSVFPSLITRSSKQQNKTVNVGYHYM